MAQTENDASLAPFFLLSLLTLVLIPWTYSKVFGGKRSSARKFKLHDPSTDWGAAAFSLAKRSKPSVQSRILGVLTLGNFAFVLAWALELYLLYLIATTTSSQKVFNPYEILDLSIGATEAQIKKAYRKLSLQYHPDKNPDPKAHEYFAEYIAKAYNALTDEESRRNYEKWGHPDGRQATNFGVALPGFLFDKRGNMAPYLLLLVSGCGILLPLSLAVCYLVNSGKYTANNILQQTVYNFEAMTTDKMSTSRVLEVLSCAQEYINMQLKVTHQRPMQELVAQLKADAEPIVKRSQKIAPSVIRAMLFFLAQAGRKGHSMPEGLWSDFMYVCENEPKFLAQLLQSVLHPSQNKVRGPGYGFLQPALAMLQFSQVLTQACPMSHPGLEKLAQKYNKAKAWPSMLQVPHFDEDVIRKLQRDRVWSLQDLLSRDSDDRKLLLQDTLSSSAIQDVNQFVDAVPNVLVSVECVTEGEDMVCEDDIVACKVRILMFRLNSSGKNGKVCGGFQPPLFPSEKQEGWWLMLAEPTSNSIISSQRVELKEVKCTTELSAAARSKYATGKDAKKDTKKKGDVVEEEGEDAPGLVACSEVDLKEAAGAQTFTLKFRAPPAQTYTLCAHLVSDHWVGIDHEETFTLKVGKPPTVDEAAERAKEEEEKERRRTAKAKKMLAKYNAAKEEQKRLSKEEEEEEAGGAKDGAPTPEPSSGDLSTTKPPPEEGNDVGGEDEAESGGEAGAAGGAAAAVAAKASVAEDAAEDEEDEEDEADDEDDEDDFDDDEEYGTSESDEGAESDLDDNWLS